ncbi:hypothetical protein LDENG_00062640 [Lucifuga dentata]|nr:hypothetical protein LDENG_00062640 [Lucifuga dentata]
MEEIQKKLVDFSGQASWLKAAQRFLYQTGLRRQDMAELLLQRAGRLGFSKHLFLVQLHEADISGLTPFYTSELQARQVLRASRDRDAAAGMWLFEELLFYNSFLDSHTLSSASLQSALNQADCVKIVFVSKLDI